MNHTSIEWVKNPDGTQGYTWNPITGCLNHVNGMCKGGNFPCYAYRLAHGRLKGIYISNPNCAGYDADKLTGRQKIDILEDPFYPRFWPERLDELNPVYGQDHRAMFKGIFVCDMSDLFGIGVPEEWTRKVLKRIGEFYYHRFYLLTKQPQNLIKFSPFPDNAWVGVTAVGGDKQQASFFDAVHYLSMIQAKVKYVSLEPLLGKVENLCEPNILDPDEYSNFVELLDWLIIGAQTKPYKPPEIEWVREIVEAADKAGIPVFLKYNLVGHLPIELPFYKQDTEGWAIRQELPNGK